MHRVLVGSSEELHQPPEGALGEILPPEVQSLPGCLIYAAAHFWFICKDGADCFLSCTGGGVIESWKRKVERDLEKSSGPAPCVVAGPSKPSPSLADVCPTCY